MTFKIDQMEAIINFANESEEPILVVCTGNVIDAMKVLKPFSSNIGYVYNEDLSIIDDPIFVLERVGEVINDVDDLKLKPPSNNLEKMTLAKEEIVQRSITTASISKLPQRVDGNIGIMLSNDMYNKDISKIDTLIIMFDSNYIKGEQLEEELTKYIKSKPKATSYIGNHKSLSYIDITNMSYSREGDKIWRRIVLEDTNGRYNKSQVYDKLSGDNPLIVNVYITKSTPKFTLSSLIGGNNEI